MADGSHTSMFSRAKKYYLKNGLGPILSLAVFYAPSLLYHRRLGMRSYNTGGIDLFEAEWDNLVILDACRYDIFAEAVDLNGRTETRTSRASSTSEFIRANFRDRDLQDVVYVSANPWFAKLRDEIGASVHEYYDVHNEPEEQPHVDQMYRTTEIAQRAADEYPKKRLLIHYAPPHHPLFGPTAKNRLPSIESQIKMGFYERIRRGNIDIDDEVLRRAYTETLEIVIDEVKTLLGSLFGKTVISADHGEMLGERAWPIPIEYYGHVPGLYTDELVTVPWHVCEYSDRREIVAERSDHQSQIDTDVDEKLRDLGYKI